MKRGSEGEKIMGPMFPRLHVNDTEKGGPRAPPRNKMALYEQLSIPSQRFNHAALTRNLSNNSACLVSQSSQGSGNDRGMFFARQLHPIHPSEMQYSQYSELSTPQAQVEQRNNVDEDDYAVPVFIQPVYSKAISQEKISPSVPPYLHASSKFQKANETGMFVHCIGKEGRSKKGENSNESVAGQKQTVSSISHEPGANLANSVYRLRTDDSGVSSDSLNTDAKLNSSDLEEASPLQDQNIVHDLSNDTGSHEDESCKNLQSGNLERGDSVSETSILDTESALDITPDDIVGIIGQKHFWKARRAIMNQQRVFSVQVFELHRLIKVQKLIAASPHLLFKDSSFFDQPTKPLQRKKRPLDSAVNPSQKKERSAENTLEKTPPSAAAQIAVPPSSCSSPPPPQPPQPPTLVSNDHNTSRASFYNPPEGTGQQWLIPVMSPSEGLVYKPYPAPGYPGQGYAPPPTTGSFLPPVFGIPTPPPQYPFPMYGSQGYFPPYGMPMMSAAVYTRPNQNNEPTLSPVPDVLGPCAAEEIEVQGSSTSSPSERQQGTSTSAIEASELEPRAGGPGSAPRVIKVVPRNGLSASESAARIFRSIQEERMQYDSVWMERSLLGFKYSNHL